MPSALIVTPPDATPSEIKACEVWLGNNIPRDFLALHQTVKTADPTDADLDDALIIVLPRLIDFIPLAGREMGRRAFVIVGTRLDTRPKDQSAGGRREAVAALEPLFASCREIITRLSATPAPPLTGDSADAVPQGTPFTAETVPPEFADSPGPHNTPVDAPASGQDAPEVPNPAPEPPAALPDAPESTQKRKKRP